MPRFGAIRKLLQLNWAYDVSRVLGIFWGGRCSSVPRNHQMIFSTFPCFGPLVSSGLSRGYTGRGAPPISVLQRPCGSVSTPVGLPAGVSTRQGPYISPIQKLCGQVGGVRGVHSSSKTYAPLVHLGE